MVETRWILVPVDFSTASYLAAHKAAWLANEVGASLHLVHATDGYGAPEMFGGAASGTWWRGDDSYVGIALAKKELSELAESFDALGPKVTHEVAHGTPLSVVRDAIRQGRGDLVVLGVHSHHHWWHLFAQTTSARAIRRLERPVLAVKEGARTSGAIQNVVVLTDFEEPSVSALDFAIGFARSVGARLDLVHALALRPFFPYDAAPPVEWCERARHEAWTSLGTAVERVRESGLRGRGTVAECDPVQAIEREPIGSADLVVVGTQGRSGLRRLILGSVAQRILHWARCSVAVVH